MVNSPAASQVLTQFEQVFFAAMPDCVQLDIAALAALPCGDATLRLAALLHKDGAETAAAALQSLKLSTVFTRECLELVTHYDTKIIAADVPLLLSRLGEKQLRRLLLLQRCASLEAEIQRALDEKLPLSLRDLAVNGRDLIAAGIPSGRQVGEVLERLHEMVLRREIANESSVLLEVGRTLLS